METIFECLGKEFQDVEFTSMNINPSHTVTYSKNGTEENVITLTITVYNNIHKLVGKKVIKFVNDKYKITPSKKLEHITPEEVLSNQISLFDRHVFKKSRHHSNIIHFLICIQYFE